MIIHAPDWTVLGASAFGWVHFHQGGRFEILSGLYDFRNRDADNNGVPDKPLSILLRARSTSEFDEQGRAFKAHTFSVDQTTGMISSNSLTTSFFFDHRGLSIKQQSPGGLVTKMLHDGAARTTITFTTDGGGDLTWTDAGNVTGDIVLECRAILFLSGYAPVCEYIIMQEVYWDACRQAGDPTWPGIATGSGRRSANSTVN